MAVAHASVRAQVLRAVDRAPELPAATLARELVDEIGEDGLRSFAREQIEKIITTERRRMVRKAEARAEEGLADLDAAKWGVVEQLLEEYRQEVIVDWTAELLASDFALGDGSKVAWGEATVAQHGARIAILQRNVRGNLDTIRRHEAAIAAIGAGKATRLNEVIS